MVPEITPLTTKAVSGSPYQLDKSQTLKASTALLKHIKSEAKRKEAVSNTKNLLADPAADSSDEADSNTVDPIWLVVTTKKHIADQKRLKPGKIILPHSLNNIPTTSICLFTADPQRTFKDAIANPSFSSELSARITRILGIAKLKARYKSFESRRQLLAEHDVFLADARIITLLPNLLGKTFYRSSSKRPIPVNLEPYKSRPKNPTSGERLPVAKPSKAQSTPPRSVAEPAQIAHEIQRTLSCAQVYLSPAATTSVRVGLASLTPEQVAENVEVVVSEMVDRFITNKWRNVRAIHIKGPNTMALPVWLADELWVDEADVLEEEEAKQRLEAGKQRGKRKEREGETHAVEGRNNQKKQKTVDEGFSAEMKERREKLRKQKQEIRDEVAEETRRGEGGQKVKNLRKGKAIISGI
ncbi:hypothetical protein MMC07_005104 [Pseudocyphellaria aurata]|nr:hypothetical protein [Pseudocyphellaria aurata]